MIITLDDEIEFRQILIDLNYQLAIKCFEFLIEQRRNDADRRVHFDGELHIVKNYYHELSVAQMVWMFCTICQMVQNFENFIVVALMHDMLEDKKDVAYELLKLIGEENFNLVAALSKNSEQYDGFHKIGSKLLTLLVKACDRMVNCTNAIGVFTKKRLARYVAETEEMLEIFQLCAKIHNVQSTNLAVIILQQIHKNTATHLENM